MVDRLVEHLRGRAGLYTFVLVLYVAGVAFGALAVNHLESGQQQELTGYLESLFTSLAASGGRLDPTTPWTQGMAGDLKALAGIWLLGLTVVGSPVVLGLVFLRGFISGFAVGFLVFQKGLKGVLFAAVSILLPNLLVIPALVVISVGALSFALFAVSHRRSGRSGFRPGPLAGYALVGAGGAAATVAAGLIRTYVAPSLMYLVATWI